MDTIIELYGYLGSALVVVSMLMASVVKLRVINTIGSVFSGTYALIIGSFPLALMNICLIVINVYNLVKLLRTQQKYDLIAADPVDSFVQYFLQRHGKDIQNYFPSFGLPANDLDAAYLVCCEGNPAGLLLGRRQSDGTVAVALDYSTPAYRDCSVGAFLSSKLPSLGVTTLTFAHRSTDAHHAYLKKMGFVQQGEVYVKTL